MISALLEGNKRFVSEHFSKEKEFCWLISAHKARERVDEKLRALHIEIPVEQRMKLIVEENVRLQVEHLTEYPCVRAAMRAKKLDLHGWVHDMTGGEIKVLKTGRPHKG